MESEIRTAIQEMLEEEGCTTDDFVVEHPADTTHGDYASNVALLCAKELGANPREVGERFAKALEGRISQVEKIEVAGPGFLNFHLRRDFFVEKIASALQAGNAWGSNKRLTNEKILFEYTSPNLFKPLHIGNLVGNIIGESIARLFEFGGATVYRLNYPSDIGLTVAKGVWGIKKIKGDPNDVSALGEAYRVGNEAYETDEEAKAEIEAVNRALYAGEEPELQKIRLEGIQASRLHLAQLCERLGTIFDADIPESEASPRGLEIVKHHTGQVFEESDGAVVFRGDKHGLHTRVFLNSQGLPTYEAKDLGNFALKHEKFPDWTRSYIVTGNEQKEYFKVVMAALREVFPETQKKFMGHIPTGFLTLSTGKMSSRKGNVLTAESMLEEVQEAARKRAQESRADDIEELTELLSVSALKYQILRQAVGSDIVFDKERALSLEGDSGPYLEYTHARIFSILNKAKAHTIEPSTENPPEEVYETERLVYQFPEIVLRAQTECAPHYLITYLTALAASFNSFYAKEQIVDEQDEYAPYKLALAKAVQQTLKNGLNLLGIKSVDRM